MDLTVHGALRLSCAKLCKAVHLRLVLRRLCLCPTQPTSSFCWHLKKVGCDIIYIMWQWMWMDVDGCGWMWMDVDGCGWMWMDVDGCGWISSWYGRISEIVSANISNHHWFEELLCSGLRLCSEQLEGHHRSSEKKCFSKHIQSYIFQLRHRDEQCGSDGSLACLDSAERAGYFECKGSFDVCEGRWGQMRAEWICLRASRGDPVANTQAACLALVYFLNLLKSSWYWVLQRFAEVHCITAATNASPNSLTALGIKETGINS